MTAAETLARHRIARAHAALQEADVLLDRGHPGGALNRLYYSAFYAARALLALRQVDSSRHAGVIALFQEHFVRSGTVAAEAARALPRAFEKRQTSDYGDFVEPSREEVLSLREQVRDFIEACERVVAESGSE